MKTVLSVVPFQLEDTYYFVSVKESGWWRQTKITKYICKCTSENGMQPIVNPILFSDEIRNEIFVMLAENKLKGE
jgi:hypothetical protein